MIWYPRRCISQNASADGETTLGRRSNNRGIRQVPGLLKRRNQRQPGRQCDALLRSDRRGVNLGDMLTYERS